MADYTLSVPVPDYKQGDRWLGIASIGPVLINEAQPSAALERVAMRFQLRDVAFSLVGTCPKAEPERYLIDSQTTGDTEAEEFDNRPRDAPAVIDDAATWAAHIPEIKTGFLPTPGVWDWDIAFYATGDAVPLTIYKGSITVHPRV